LRGRPHRYRFTSFKHGLCPRLHRGLALFFISSFEGDRLIGRVANVQGAPNPMAQASKRSARRPISRAKLPPLTPRQLEILALLAKGLSYGQVAERLNISKQTVPAHIKNIYRKLQANNRSAAVYKAMQRDLIQL